MQPQLVTGLKIAPRVYEGTDSADVTELQAAQIDVMIATIWKATAQ